MTPLLERRWSFLWNLLTLNWVEIFYDLFDLLKAGCGIEVDVRSTEHTDIFVPVFKSVSSLPNKIDSPSILENVYPLILFKLKRISTLSQRPVEAVHNVYQVIVDHCICKNMPSLQLEVPSHLTHLGGRYSKVMCFIFQLDQNLNFKILDKLNRIFVVFPPKLEIFYEMQFWLEKN